MSRRADDIDEQGPTGYPGRACKNERPNQPPEGRTIWQLVGVLDTYGS